MHQTLSADVARSREWELERVARHPATLMARERELGRRRTSRRRPPWAAR